MQKKVLYGFKSADAIIKDLDKVKTRLLKEFEELVAKKKKLYSNMDITQPMSAAEKTLDKQIADISSEIFQIINQKRTIKKMRIVELVLDDMQLANGIDAISIVESPAIESNFIALSGHKIEFKTLDLEKRILLGPALIPNKPIYRNQDNEEFYVYFSKATIEKASQLYLKRGNQAKATLEHQINLAGLTLVESWIKVDMEKDKSAAYGLNDVVGTWYVAMKVDNEEIWTEYVKTGRVKGFSIEGFFADKSTEMAKVSKDEMILNELKKLLKNI